LNSLTLIIPAYNEEKSLEKFLPTVVSFCKQKGYKLIVVNDGSKDGTAKVLGQYSNESFVKILHNKVNGGYGAAIKKGVRNAETDFVVTLDADGQHNLEDVEKLFQKALETDADMVVGNRGNSSGGYRSLGKWLIRRIAGILMPMHVTDINSGMKLYNSELAKKYIKICPETMAYSDIILLAFIYKRHLVIEVPITVNPRTEGNSTISTMTAIDTLKEIVNIVVLFNPIRIFFPIGTLFIILAIAWGLPILLNGNGVSVGTMLGIITGIIFYFFGLLAHQVGSFRKESLE
jgi:glycosyltransferase involved in cell wall biosynthesis